MMATAEVTQEYALQKEVRNLLVIFHLTSGMFQEFKKHLKTFSKENVPTHPEKGKNLTPEYTGLPEFCFGETHNGLLDGGFNPQVPYLMLGGKKPELRRLYTLDKPAGLVDAFEDTYLALLERVWQYLHIHDNGDVVNATLLNGREMSMVPNGARIGTLVLEKQKILISRGTPKLASREM